MPSEEAQAKATEASGVDKLMWQPVLELTHNHGTESAEGPAYWT